MKKPFTEKERTLANEVSRKLERLILPTQIKPLRRAANLLRKLYEAECNGCTREKLSFESWEQYDKARDQQMLWVEKRVKAVETRIAKLCAELDIPFFLQTDPRGCSLYLGTTSDSRYNTEGVAIY